MDFALTEQERDLASAAREYAAERLAPVLQAARREGVLDRATLGRWASSGSSAWSCRSSRRARAGLRDRRAGARGDVRRGLQHRLALDQRLPGGQILRDARAARDVVAPWLEAAARGDPPGDRADRAGRRLGRGQRSSLRARRDGDDYVLTGRRPRPASPPRPTSRGVGAHRHTGGSGARGISAFLVPLDRPG